MKFELPRLMLITQRVLMQPSFDESLESALRGGARLIQLRENDLSEDALLALALRAANLCRKYDARLVINSSPMIANAVADSGCAAGVQWKARDVSQIIQSEILSYGVSVHSLEEARAAQESGADYLVFGSVFRTASHPAAHAAGLGKLHEVCVATSLPVFAVGGVDQTNARACLESGAHGVAAIRAVWNTQNVGDATRAMLHAVKSTPE